MNIRRFYFVVIYCAVFVRDSTARTFSLNEAIAVETQQKQTLETTSTPKLPETAAERFSLNKALSHKPLLSKKKKETESLLLRSTKLSPLKYRKTFQIKTPLKPKKLTRSPKQRYKVRNQSIKREINGNDKLNQKYIPLLKSIGMLFDNLLDTDASNSYETASRKRKRNRYKSISPEEGNRVVCKCAVKPNIEKTEPASSEKAVAIPDFRTATPISTEGVATIETTTTPTNYTPVSDVSSLGQHKNVPLLLPGNTISSRGNDNGIDERSGTTYNRSSERHFTRNYGNNEHITGCGENESYPQCNEEFAYSPSRDSASGNGSSRGEFGNGKDISTANVSTTTNESIAKEDENATENYRFATKFKREDNLETGGNETKSTKLLSEPVYRLRGHISENKIEHTTALKQSQEIHTESFFNVAYDNAGYKRITNRSRPITTENKEIRSGNETIISSDNYLGPNLMTTKNRINKPPVVMIIDGYSVTRNKHGENKLTKKSIHFHP